MPAAAIGPAIVSAAPAIASAVGTLGSAYMAQRGSKHATNAQMSATRDALAYEREREASRRVEYEKAMHIYQQNYKAWYDRYGDAGIDRYGMPKGIFLPGKGKPKADVTGPRRSGGTFATMVGLDEVPSAQGADVPAATPEQQQAGTLADLSSWNDWRRYGA